MSEKKKKKKNLARLESHCPKHVDNFSLIYILLDFFTVILYFTIILGTSKRHIAVILVFLQITKLKTVIIIA